MFENLEASIETLDKEFPSQKTESLDPQYLSELKKLIVPGQYRALHRNAVQAAEELKSKETLLIRALQEVDQNLVYRYLGFSSLYQYCLQALKLTESQSVMYISVARKSRSLPALQRALDNGEVSVSKVSRVVSVINETNQTSWIEMAKSSTKYEIEKAVAKVNPRLASPEKARFLNDTVLELQVPLNESAFKDLKRVQDLLSQKTKKHISLEEVITYLSKDYLKRQDPLAREARREKRQATTMLRLSSAKMVKAKNERQFSSRLSKNKLSCLGTIDRDNLPCLNTVVEKKVSLQNQDPSTNPRTIKPRQSKIKRSSIDKALTRDQSQCTAETPAGRCPETRWLQVHHVIHQEHGGGHELHNLQTLCASHHRERHLHH